MPSPHAGRTPAEFIIVALMTLGLATAPQHVVAQQYTWVGASGSWSVGTNWQGGTAPPVGGGAGVSLRFTADNTFYTATNNLGNPFAADRIVFDSTQANPDSTSGIVITNAISNSLRLTGANPTIGMAGTGKARLPSFTVPAALVLDNAAPAIDLQLLTFAGGNVIPGGVTLQRGNLEVGANNALGAGTFTVNGGTLRSAGAILPNPVTLNADLLHLGTDAATDVLRFTQAAVLSGVGGFAHRGQGTVDVQSASTFTGRTTVRETAVGYRLLQSGSVGVLSLSGANGSVLGSSELVVAGGGTLRLDNTTANYNRLGNATPITLGSGVLQFLAGSGGVEQAGVLTLSGYSVIQAGQTANGTEAGLTFAGLSRSADRGTVVFRGDNLGATARVRFGGGPVADLVGGGGAAGSTTVSVLPYASAIVSPNALPTTLATYDGAGGVRPLTTAEFASTLTDGQSTTQNIRLGDDLTLTSPTTVNSLLLRDDAQFPGLVRVSGTTTLTVTSGAVLSVRSNDRIDPGLAFGNREGHLITTQRLILSGPMTGTNGVTVSGGGELNVTGTNSGLTGPLTVNGGNVTFDAPGNLPGSGPVVLGGGTGNLSGGVGTAVLTYTGPTNSSITLGRGLRLTGVGRITTLGGASGPTITLAGVIDGPGTLYVGNGRIVVTQPNTHTGGTVVSGFANGSLVAANSAGSATGAGPVFLRSGGVVTGNGRVVGQVIAEPSTVTNEAAGVAPSGPLGTGVGRLTVGGLDLRQGVYYWQLGGLFTSGPGVNFDQVVVEAVGTRLDPAGRVTLDFSLLPTGDRPTAVANGAGFWTSPRQWHILDWTEQGEFSGQFGGVSNPTWVAGTFGLTHQGGDVYLNFTPVPEPMTALAVGAIALGATVVRRRRRPFRPAGGSGAAGGHAGDAAGVSPHPRRHRRVRRTESHDAAVDAFRRHVRRHVVEPEPPPRLTDLPQVFRLVDQLIRADQRIAGVLVDTAGAGQRQPDPREQR